jgi:hypothetical protein
MTVEKRKKKKRRERKEKKVSHQGSPNFKLLIHRQSSSAPKAFCYCHCPEDFAQEFEEQKKKGWSWIHPLETLSPSSSVGIVFSSTTVIIIIEVYGAEPAEGQKIEGTKSKEGQAESILWRLWAPSAVLESCSAALLLLSSEKSMVQAQRKVKTNLGCK